MGIHALQVCCLVQSLWIKADQASQPTELLFNLSFQLKCLTSTQADISERLKSLRYLGAFSSDNHAFSRNDTCLKIEWLRTLKRSLGRNSIRLQTQMLRNFSKLVLSNSGITLLGDFRSCVLDGSRDSQFRDRGSNYMDRGIRCISAGGY